MIDVDMLKKGLEKCLDPNLNCYHDDIDCPYESRCWLSDSLPTRPLKEDMLALLQESVGKCSGCLFVKRDKGKNVVETDNGFNCPSCGTRIAGRMTDGTILLETPGDDLPEYCFSCGQKIDWEVI